MAQVVNLRPGEYKSCGMTLRITETQEGSRVSVESKDRATLSWSFSREGVFRELAAQSPASNLARDMPATLLACRHVGEGLQGRVMLCKGPQMGWVCCPSCVREMLHGEDVHLISADAASQLLKGCNIMEVKWARDEEGGG